VNHRNVLQWRKTALVIAVALGTTVTLAAVTRLTISTPFAISDGDAGDKPKIQRAGDGTLVVIYGDDTPGAGNVYDTKSDAERPARDVYVKTCKPGTVRPDTVVRTCDVPEDWSTARNLSGSALQSSIATAWQGGDPVASRMPYPGDIDKVNIKTSGPVIVASWIGNYCPDGDLATPGIQPPVQRAIRYLERDSRVIPFACTWVTYTANNGTTWSAPAQLSTGERDAKQDAHSGNVNTDPASPSFRRGQVIISWQEDPMGLQPVRATVPVTARPAPRSAAAPTSGTRTRRSTSRSRAPQPTISSSPRRRGSPTTGRACTGCLARSTRSSMVQVSTLTRA